MNDGSMRPELVRDDAVTNALRELYAAPAGDAYWTALEARVLSALDAEESVFSLSDRWLRRGLVAAAVIVLIAGALVWRAQTAAERSMAFEGATEIEGLGTALAQRDPVSAEQATLRKLTGHQ